MRNRHFATTDDEFGAVPFPIRLYAVVDHLEAGVTSNLVAFDCVDADWLDGVLRDPYFDSDEPTHTKELWEKLWKRTAASPSPIDDMPVYRLELDLASLGQFADPYASLSIANDSELATIEATWISLNVFANYVPHSDEGDLYHSMFLAPRRVHVKARAPSREAVATLELITDLSHLPLADGPLLERLVDKTAAAEHLAVFNVGQGGANGLLNASHQVSLYYDLGCGVYRNAWSKPVPLQFCWTLPNSAIVLSHWDADHWAGAQVPHPNPPPSAPSLPALSRDWIVPVQKIGPVHLAFANSIAPGHLWKFTSSSSHLIAGGRRLTLELAKGASRNHSGIVLLAEKITFGSSWLLSGDCDYKYFASALAPSHVVALTAPHHGASLANGSLPPTAPSRTYQRVVYSFGINNSHGKSSISHPTTAGVMSHDTVGWRHGAVWPTATNPGVTPPATDALATSVHTAGITRSVPPTTWLGGVLVGWSPPTSASSCSCYPLLSQF